MPDSAIIESEPKRKLLEAAKRVLLAEGFAGLSTRAVAAEAATQMSQIRYHFGSKEGMILALFEYMNAQLIARQSETFENPSLSFSEKWALACDYLDEDLASGYVRVLQELIAVGWANPVIGEAVRGALNEWRDLLIAAAEDFARQRGGLEPFTAEEAAALIAAAFIGTEAFVLLDSENRKAPMRAALRRIGEVIAKFEKS